MQFFKNKSNKNNLVSSMGPKSKRDNHLIKSRKNKDGKFSEYFALEEEDSGILVL
jgi:hypothetical protein